jgi:ubiquitin-conjugating enzyme E2 H
MQKSNPLLSKKRRERDIARLKQKGFEVDRLSEQDICVSFHGPKDTLYEKGIWHIRVHLPAEYPYKSPSLGFLHKIYHPNIDFQSGSICLDVINQTWTPMYELFNIFGIFLPQLLTYPNPADPLNIDAANLLRTSTEKYNLYVRKQVLKHALNGKELANLEKKSKEPERESTIPNEPVLELIEEIEERPDEGNEDNKSFALSGQSQLSELSDTSGLLLEEDIFGKD